MNRLQSHGSIARYTLGFAGSVVLTFVAYWLVTEQVLHGWTLLIALMGLAVLQLWVQLVCFLHIGAGRDKLWRLASFWFMALFVVTIVIGSLWIMHNLNYNMMPAEQMDEHMMVERDKGF